MFKYIISLLLIVFLFAVAGQTIAATEPTISDNKKTETDSLSVNKDKNILISSEIKTNSENSENFWEKNEEVEEDSTSNSALSFNFIYYIIEKFKFQVE